MATKLNNGLVLFDRKRIGLRTSKGSTSTGRIQHVSIHHAGPTGKPPRTFKSASALIRGFQAYHMDGQGWNDIGYNLLVDAGGRLYQGRTVGSLPAAVGNHNSNSVGICFMQDGRYHALTRAQRRTLAKLFRYGIPRLGLPPLRGLKVYGHNEYSGHTSNECPGGRIKKHLIWRRNAS